jgi:hypothetical protein
MVMPRIISSFAMAITNIIDIIILPLLNIIIIIY